MGEKIQYLLTCFFFHELRRDCEASRERTDYDTLLGFKGSKKSNQSRKKRGVF